MRVFFLLNEREQLVVEKCCFIRKTRKAGFVNEELSIREFVCKGVRYRKKKNNKKSVFVVAGACKPHACDNDVPLPGVQNT